MTCTSSYTVDVCSTTFRKCLARSLPVLTHVGFSHCLDDGHSINNGNLMSCTIGLIVRWWWFDYQALQNSHKLTLNCTGPHRAIKCEERSWKHSKLKFTNALLQIQLWSCEYHNKEARKQFTVVIHGYEFVACCAFVDLSCTLPYEEFDFLHWAPDAHFLVHQSFLNEFIKHLLPNRIALNDGIFHWVRHLGGHRRQL